MESDGGDGSSDQEVAQKAAEVSRRHRCRTTGDAKPNWGDHAAGFMTLRFLPPYLLLLTLCTR